jgi:hypothetical protein
MKQSQKEQKILKANKKYYNDSYIKVLEKQLQEAKERKDDEAVKTILKEKVAYTKQYHRDAFGG